MRRLWASLRFRLAVTGFAAIYIPVLVLLTVTIATEDIATVGISSEDGSPVSLENEEEAFEVVTEGSAGPSPWVAATALLLAPGAAALAWWWAGRAVGPIDRIRVVAEDIDAGDLERRIGLDRGPTELVGLAGAFDGMLERLSEAATVQRGLIEETSHELRTPLAVLTTNADVLLTHPEPSIEVFRTGIERSRDAAVRLTSIIDDLLVDARGRARSLDRRPADLVEIVAAAVDRSLPLAASNNVHLEVAPSEPVRCRVDESSVGRAVANLLDNAIRHGGEGTSVEVEVGLAPESAEADPVAIVAVTDHGEGIGPDEQDRVFDRFWRASDDGSGVGLGLPIVKQIAEAHGGRVVVRSPGPAGDGARFELWLSC